MTVEYSRYLCDPIQFGLYANGIRWGKRKLRFLCLTGSDGHVNENSLVLRQVPFLDMGRKKTVPWQRTTGVPASSIASQEALESTSLFRSPSPFFSSSNTTNPLSVSKMITFPLASGSHCGVFYLSGQVHQVPGTSFQGYG